MQNHFHNIRFEEIHSSTPPERMNCMRLGLHAFDAIHNEVYWRRLHVGGAEDAGMRESFVRDVRMNDILDRLIDKFSATKMDLPIICGLGYNKSGKDNPAVD